jgi:hypothetical protein
VKVLPAVLQFIFRTSQFRYGIKKTAGRSSKASLCDWMIRVYSTRNTRCHHVVGSGGELTGYGGGLWRKDYLLALEQAQSFHLS